MDGTRGRYLFRTVDPDTVARAGLGAMLLAAGVHKLFAPGVWAAYVVDWLEPFLLLAPVTFMLVNGVLEIGFGLALIADRYTTVSSAVAAVSLAATTAYLTVVGLTQNGLFLDVMTRDIGLTALATAVLLRALEDDE